MAMQRRFCRTVRQDGALFQPETERDPAAILRRVAVDFRRDHPVPDKYASKGYNRRLRGVKPRRRRFSREVT